MNNFELEIRDNGFGFPCCICKYNTESVSLCFSCKGYTMNSEELFITKQKLIEITSELINSN